jgi:hypothetical protein
MTLADRAFSAISRASDLDTADAAVKVAEAQVYATLALGKQFEFLVDTLKKALDGRDSER